MIALQISPKQRVMDWVDRPQIIRVCMEFYNF